MRAVTMSNFRIISRNGGAKHVDGMVLVKTVGPLWGQDSEEIEKRAYVPYYAENHCGAVTKIAHWCYTHKRFDTVEEVAQYFADQQKYGYKVCRRCQAAVAEAVARKQQQGGTQ